MTKSYSPDIVTVFFVVFMIINVVLQTAGFANPLIYITLFSGIKAVILKIKLRGGDVIIFFQFHM